MPPCGGVSGRGSGAQAETGRGAEAALLPYKRGPGTTAAKRDRRGSASKGLTRWRGRTLRPFPYKRDRARWLPSVAGADSGPPPHAPPSIRRSSVHLRPRLQPRPPAATRRRFVAATAAMVVGWCRGPAAVGSGGNRGLAAAAVGGGPETVRRRAMVGVEGSGGPALAYSPAAACAPGVALRTSTPPIPLPVHAHRRAQTGDRGRRRGGDGPGRPQAGHLLLRSLRRSLCLPRYGLPPRHLLLRIHRLCLLLSTSPPPRRGGAEPGPEAGATSEGGGRRSAPPPPPRRLRRTGPPPAHSAKGLLPRTQPPSSGAAQGLLRGATGV